MEFIVGMEFIVKVFKGKYVNSKIISLDKYWEKILIFELFRGQFIKRFITQGKAKKTHQL